MLRADVDTSGNAGHRHSAPDLADLLITNVEKFAADIDLNISDGVILGHCEYLRVIETPVDSQLDGFDGIAAVLDTEGAAQRGVVTV